MNEPDVASEKRFESHCSFAITPSLQEHRAFVSLVAIATIGSLISQLNAMLANS